MVYIEAQKTLEATSSSDIRDGTILTVPTSVSTQKKSPKSAGRKGR
jgi:hypothetical protein